MFVRRVFCTKASWSFSSKKTKSVNNLQLSTTVIFVYFASVHHITVVQSFAKTTDCSTRIRCFLKQ